MSDRSISGVSSLCPCFGTLSRHSGVETKKLSSLVVYCKNLKSDTLEKPSRKRNKEISELKIEYTRAMAQQVSLFCYGGTFQCFTEIPLYKGRHPTRIPFEEPEPLI